jgi:hypothetical protein
MVDTVSYRPLTHAIIPTKPRDGAEEEGARLRIPIQTDPSSPEGVLLIDY